MAVCLISSCTCFPYKFESGGHYTIKKYDSSIDANKMKEPCFYYIFFFSALSNDGDEVSGGLRGFKRAPRPQQSKMLEAQMEMVNFQS